MQQKMPWQVWKSLLQKQAASPQRINMSDIPRKYIEKFIAIDDKDFSKILSYFKTIEARKKNIIYCYSCSQINQAG
jgi:hypothetical protein